MSPLPRKPLQGNEYLAMGLENGRTMDFRTHGARERNSWNCCTVRLQSSWSTDTSDICGTASAIPHSVDGYCNTTNIARSRYPDNIIPILFGNLRMSNV